MNLMSLSPMQTGIVKGSLITTLVFSASIGIGLYFLRQKHEQEMDELQKTTAKDCLDLAAEHYENILRRKKPSKGSVLSASVAEDAPLEETEKTHEEITTMNNYESTIDQWVELKKELTRLRAEIERTLRGFDTDYIVEERLSQNEVET